MNTKLLAAAAFAAVGLAATSASATVVAIQTQVGDVNTQGLHLITGFDSDAPKGGNITDLAAGFTFTQDPGGVLSYTRDGGLGLDSGVSAPPPGVIETDWLPFPFTMNWLFTRPGRVRFEKGEPFCFITLIQDKPLHEIQPVIRRMDSNPELRHQYDVWEKHRSDFNQRIFRQDPEATKEAWQRYYFKGEYPEEVAPARDDHINKRRLKEPRFGR